MSNITRVFDLLDHQLKNFPKEDALTSKISGKWVTNSTAKFKEKSETLAKALISFGIQKNDNIAVISFNRPEWNFVDFGVQMAGAVSVPIYPTITEEDYAYIINDADVKIIFLADQELYDKVKPAIKSINKQIPIYTFDDVDKVPHFKEFLAKSDDQYADEMEKRKAEVNPEDLLTLIYTSGTTGNPKGVMLTHNNLVSNFMASKPIVPVDHTGKALSFLPLCHIFERMVTYVYMNNGISIYYAESFDTIGDNLKEVKPHIFTTVPRLLEKVYDKIVTKGTELTGIKKKLFFWALNLGLQYDMRSPKGGWYAFQLKWANKIIFSKWREALGGNVKAIVSGGAALQPRLARVFWSAGLKVMEGYGLTETSPVIAVNRPDPKDCVVGTVGPCIEGVEIKIAEDGEILCKGPNVMKGYYKQPEMTSEVLTKDGWFHTGDIGTMVEGKYLKITDRKKEMFKTSGGKYIAPQKIENLLKQSMYIEQAVVVGNGERFAAALIMPALDALKDYAAKNGFSCTDRNDFNNDKIQKLIESEIETCNAQLAKFETIKKFKLVPDEWSIDSGELTAKLSVKRKVIYKKYEQEIKDLFQ